MTRLHTVAFGCAAVSCALLLLPGRAPETRAEPTDFIRYVPGDRGEGKLETAIATYARDDGAVVDLVAAVHIGDAA